MNNEELKKKIVDIIANIEWTDIFGIRHGGTADGLNNTIADALIAAGLRFGENLTATFNHMALEREHELERRLGEAEHRAEVAARGGQVKVYTRLTPRNWHEAKVKYSTPQAQQIILTKCWNLENAIESGELYDREEVKKETAHDILTRINKYYLNYNYDLKREFEKLCKDYGVDLEDEE